MLVKGEKERLNVKKKSRESREREKSRAQNRSMTTNGAREKMPVWDTRTVLGYPTDGFCNQEVSYSILSLWCFNINTYLALKIWRQIQPDVGDIWKIKKLGWFSAENKEIPQMKLICKEQGQEKGQLQDIQACLLSFAPLTSPTLPPPIITRNVRRDSRSLFYPVHMWILEMTKIF